MLASNNASTSSNGTSPIESPASPTRTARSAIAPPPSHRRPASPSPSRAAAGSIPHLARDPAQPCPPIPSAILSQHMGHQMQGRRRRDTTRPTRPQVQTSSSGIGRPRTKDGSRDSGERTARRIRRIGDRRIRGRDDRKFQFWISSYITAPTVRPHYIKVMYNKNPVSFRLM